MNTDNLIAAMEAAGYFFDDIDSYEGWLVFNGDYCTKMEFSDWDGVQDWLENVIFDDPEISDKVEKILHPERF